MVSTIRLDLLELFGNSYILDHIKKEIRNHDEIQFYRDCVADALAGLRGPTLFILTLLRIHSRFM